MTTRTHHERRTFLRMMGAAAIGVAASAAFGAFGPAVKRAAAAAAGGDRKPLPPKRLPRWIGHL